MLHKTSSIAIAAALALFAAQSAVAQDQNSTATGTEIQPPAATDTTTAPTTGDMGADSAQTTVPATGDMGADSAQTTVPATGDMNTGTAQTTPPATGDMGVTTAETPATDGTAMAGGSQEFITMQGADQILGSDLMGAKVRSAANEDIGDVNDVLFNMQGEAQAVIVGVGGFLGIGEKDVAIPFDRLTVGSEDGDRDDLMISLETTRDELNAAPAFETRDDAATASSTMGVAPAPTDTGSTVGTDPAMTDPAMTPDAGATTAPATNQ